MSLYIQETFIDLDREAQYGKSDVYEAFTADQGRLFRDLQHEYGRCTGRVYIDKVDKTVAIGWVFVKRVKYEDCNETYLREVWVTLHDAPDTVTREHHYHEIN